MTNPIEPIIVDAAKTLANPIYEDAVQPAMKASGKAVGTIVNCLNMLLAPLERAQLASAAKTEAFRKSLEEKYEQIPVDRR